MDRLLQQFDDLITDRSTGEGYSARVYGRSRPGDTWQAWLVFERESDGERFVTPVETTQSSWEAVVHWARGLSTTYFEGALKRALRGPVVARSTEGVPPPLIEGRANHDTRNARWAAIERDILSVFTRTGLRRMLTRDIFDALPYAHADVVRAMEDLEKNARIAQRRTEEGNDWLVLTAEGIRQAGLNRTDTDSESGSRPRR